MIDGLVPDWKAELTSRARAIDGRRVGMHNIYVQVIVITNILIEVEAIVVNVFDNCELVGHFGIGKWDVVIFMWAGNGNRGFGVTLGRKQNVIIS
jgi:hypothetical protein